MSTTRTSTAWFLVHRTTGPLPFTGATRRADAWGALRSLYREWSDGAKATENARIDEQKRTGELRAVKATLTWSEP